MKYEVFSHFSMIVEYDPETGIFYDTVLPDSIDLDEDEQKKVLIKIVENLKILKPKYYLSDQSDLACPFFADIQEWVAKLFVETNTAIALKKHAIIQSKDIFSAVSAEQTVDEAIKSPLPYEVRLFDNKKDAINWLNMM